MSLAGRLDPRGVIDTEVLRPVALAVMTVVASTSSAPIATKPKRTGRPLCSISPHYYNP